MEKDKEITAVVFRVFKDDKGPYLKPKLIALFPEIPADYSGSLCESYMLVGEHSGASYHGVIQRTRPAKPEEYKDLHDFLERVFGYNLKVYNKATWKMHRKCIDSANECRKKIRGV